jgi:hypothetical protein
VKIRGMKLVRESIILAGTILKNKLLAIDFLYAARKEKTKQSQFLLLGNDNID